MLLTAHQVVSDVVVWSRTVDDAGVHVFARSSAGPLARIFDGATVSQYRRGVRRYEPVRDLAAVRRALEVAPQLAKLRVPLALLGRLVVVQLVTLDVELGLLAIDLATLRALH